MIGFPAGRINGSKAKTGEALAGIVLVAFPSVIGVRKGCCGRDTVRFILHENGMSRTAEGQT